MLDKLSGTLPNLQLCTQLITLDLFNLPKLTGTLPNFEKNVLDWRHSH